MSRKLDLVRVWVDGEDYGLMSRSAGTRYTNYVGECIGATTTLEDAEDDAPTFLSELVEEDR